MTVILPAKKKKIRENKGACREQGLISKSVCKDYLGIVALRTVEVFERR